MLEQQTREKVQAVPFKYQELLVLFWVWVFLSTGRVVRLCTQCRWEQILWSCLQRFLVSAVVFKLTNANT